LEGKEVAEAQGVAHQMFSYMARMENNPCGAKVVKLVDSLYVAFLPPLHLTAFH